MAVLLNVAKSIFVSSVFSRRLCGFVTPHPQQVPLPPLLPRSPRVRLSHRLSPYVSIPSMRLPLWTPSLRPWPSLAMQLRAWPRGTAPRPQINPRLSPPPPASTPHRSSCSRKRTLSALPIAPKHLTTSLPLRHPPPLCLGLPPSRPLLCPWSGWMAWGLLRALRRRTDIYF